MRPAASEGDRGTALLNTVAARVTAPGVGPRPLRADRAPTPQAAQERAPEPVDSAM
ncbi:hypothetical protein [Streptomyces sp. NPDC001137]|uniref:hypothetical protein n=1 Tax=Streptomyces sp. NPDC001137 TaxID=3154378 RepID=UPI003330E47C